jgi:MFS family permease
VTPGSGSTHGSTATDVGASGDRAPARNIVRLKLLFAASGAGVGTLMPYLAVYLASQGLSATLVGLVLGLMAAVGVVMVPLWGAGADRRLGAAWALRLSCAAASVASLALLAVGSWLPGIIVVAAVLAAARAPGEALADTLAMSVLGSTGGRRYGSIRLWSSAGFAVAVAAWGVVLERTSLSIVLVAYPVALTLVFAAATGLRVTASPGPAASTLRALQDVIDPRVGKLLVGAALFGIAMGASWTVLPLRLTDLGGGVGAVAAAAVVGALAEIPFMLSSGFLRHRWGSGPVFVVGGLLFSASAGCYGLLDEPRLLVAASVLRGAGYALVYVGLVTAMASLLPAQRQATGQALLQTTLMGLAPVVGASLGGFTYEQSPTLMFGAVSALAIVGTVIARIATDDRSR